MNFIDHEIQKSNNILSIIIALELDEMDKKVRKMVYFEGPCGKTQLKLSL